MPLLSQSILEHFLIFKQANKIYISVAFIFFFHCNLFSQTAVAPAGSGTMTDPYQIASLNNLYWISVNRSSWSKHFIQTADIDASATVSWNGGKGFPPIGDRRREEFSGSYNGQDHTIDKLYINDYIRDAGLFAFTKGAVIRNIGLTNIYINAMSDVGALVGTNISTVVLDCFCIGDIVGKDNVGGLIGSNKYSNLDNCYSIGRITGTRAIGGIIGSNEGSVVTNCYSTGNISGNRRNGGLIGNNYNSVVLYCYHSGTVSGTTRAGGLIGSNSDSSLVYVCFSVGNINGSEYIGGLIGYNSSSTISNCYCRADITSANNRDDNGVFCGMNRAGTIEYSYSIGNACCGNNANKGFVGKNHINSIYNKNFWDIQASNQSSAIGATAKNTQEMKTQITFTIEGWNFHSIWKIDSTINDGYPYFNWQKPSVPQIIIQPNSQIVPESANVSFRIVASGIALSYQWKKNGINIPGANSNILNLPNVKMNDIGNYRCAISNSYGSDISNIASLKVIQAFFDINDSLQCFSGNRFEFYYDSTGTLNQKWLFGDGDSSIQKNPIHSYDSSGIFKVKLLVKSSKDCYDSITRNIIVHPQPKASFTVKDSAQCFDNQQFEFTDNSRINAQNAISKWYFGDGDTASGITQKHSYAGPGSYDVKLLISNNHGCKDSANHTVYVYAMPDADFSINDSMQCFDDHLFVFKNTSSITSGNLNLSWDLGDGTASPGKDSICHAYQSFNSYKVKLLTQSDHACKDSVVKRVQVFPVPKADFDINDSMQCFNAHEFIFQNKSGIGSGSLTYHWDFDDGQTSSNCDTKHCFAYPSDFRITLICSSQNACSDSISKNVYIHPMPKADFTVNDSDQCFSRHLFRFNNNSSISQGSLTYQWQFGDGGSTTSPNTLHNYTQDGHYKVLLMATSSKQCTDTFEQSVTLYPDPVADFLVDHFCYGDQTRCINQSIPGDASPLYLWEFGDGDTSHAYSPSHVYDTIKNYKIVLHVQNTKGCYDSMSKKISIYPLPQIMLSGDSILDPVNFNQFSVNGTYDSVYWSTGDDGNSTLIGDTGTYWVAVVDANTCRNTLYFNVIQEASDACNDLLQMNLITPNQDGINDRWKINDLIRVKPVKVSIYNRWGYEVYHSSNYMNDWEGEKDGKKLPDGTYYFIVKTGDHKICKGAVNILR